MNKMLKNIILNIIEYLFLLKETKIGRPIRCKIEEYIEAIYYVLITGVP